MRLIPWILLFLLALVSASLIQVNGHRSLLQGAEPPQAQISTMRIVDESGQPVEVLGTIASSSPSGDRTTAASVEVVDWKVEYLPRNYDRPERPREESVQAFVRLRNHSARNLAGVVLQARFLDASGRVLREERISCLMALPPWSTGDFHRFWFAENNEFDASDPFDTLRPPKDCGTLRLDLQIREEIFKPTTAPTQG